MTCGRIVYDEADPAARRDLPAGVRWISKHNPAAARGLSDGVLRAAQRIVEHVHIGALHPELAGETYRFAALTRFPYVIVYYGERRPPPIVRILQGARDWPEILRGL